MQSKNHTAKYKATTAEQYRYLCGVLLPEIQQILGVDRETAHKRMRNKLIEWGYIKRSRSELTYHQTIEITDRFKNYLERHSGEIVEPLEVRGQKNYELSSGVRKAV